MNTQVTLAHAQAQIVKNQTMLVRLQQVAQVNLARHSNSITHYQPMDDSQLGSDLYKLAVETTLRPLIFRAAVLDVFCEPDASAILLSLPNAFWFWHVLSESVAKALTVPAARLTAHQVSASLAEALSAQIGQRSAA
ncbi:hypothetical protein KBI23_15950 [bacterium]|nr:hypothetical protein [bacterium]MBP9810892.1 hypothetical protein [bacterium]